MDKASNWKKGSKNILDFFFEGGVVLFVRLIYWPRLELDFFSPFPSVTAAAPAFSKQWIRGLKKNRRVCCEWVWECVCVCERECVCVWVFTAGTPIIYLSLQCQWFEIHCHVSLRFVPFLSIDKKKSSSSLSSKLSNWGVIRQSSLPAKYQRATNFPEPISSPGNWMSQRLWTATAWSQVMIL